MKKTAVLMAGGLGMAAALAEAGYATQAEPEIMELTNPYKGLTEYRPSFTTYGKQTRKSREKSFLKKHEHAAIKKARSKNKAARKARRKNR